MSTQCATTFNPRLECGSTDRPLPTRFECGTRLVAYIAEGACSRTRLRARVTPCLRQAGTRRVRECGGFFSSAGSPEDVPTRKPQTARARQGGTIARCSFCGTSPFVSTIASTPRQFAPVSVEYPLWCSCSRSSAPAEPSRAHGKTTSPTWLPSVGTRRRLLSRSTPVCFGCLESTPPWHSSE
jgi:hypothetical protein